MRRLCWLLTMALLALALPALAQQTPTPKALFADQPIRVYLDGSGPLNFVYRAAEAQIVSIYARSLPTNPVGVDTTLDVFDAGDLLLAANDDLVSGSSDAGIENLRLTAGVYRIRLDTFARGEKGGVELHLVVAADTTQTITVGQTLSGAITGNRLPASFVFEGRAGQVVTISAQSQTANFDLLLTVFGPDGEQIENGFDDDSGAEAGFGATDPLLTALLLPVDGLYRIQVESWFGAAGTFILTLEEAEGA